MKVSLTQTELDWLLLGIGGVMEGEASRITHAQPNADEEDTAVNRLERAEAQRNLVTLEALERKLQGRP